MNGMSTIKIQSLMKLNKPPVQIYKCERLAEDCGSCLNLIEASPSYGCQWCPGKRVWGGEEAREEEVLKESKRQGPRQVIASNHTSAGNRYSNWYAGPKYDATFWKMDFKSLDKKRKQNKKSGNEARKKYGHVSRSGGSGLCVHASVCSGGSSSLCPPPEIVNVSFQKN